jgi:probable HAF family extracellular repeat protein
MESSAHGINASEQVVGQAQTESGDWHAFLWADDNGNRQSDPGEMQDLGILDAPHSHALGMNASGQVVGYTYIAPGQAVDAFLWENSVMYDLNGLIPGGSGWQLEEAAGINDLGQIVGYGYHDGQKRAFLLTPVPEPSVVGLVGLAFIVAMRRLRRG